MIGFVAALGVIGLAGAGWLNMEEPAPLTQPVALHDDTPFRYPIALWDSRVEGETTLMVHVTDEGTVDTAYVLRSSGHPAFDSAALAGSADLRFLPARRGQDSVAMWARLPVRFRMPDAARAGGTDD